MRSRAARNGLVALALLASGTAAAQGVPVFDAEGWLRRQALIDQAAADGRVQADRLATEEAIQEVERRQLEALDRLIVALSAPAAPGGEGTAAAISELEGEEGTPDSAAAVFGPAPEPEEADEGGTLGPANGDPNPAARRLFGDANVSIEELIIAVAKDTASYPGVAAAGLSPVQWRCLLQALIWQESRFQVGARSPAAAYGLTQIIPGTARQLGIYPEYYDDPYLQVEGGARYLSEQLQMFDGNIVFALAAYNAGPGAVQKYDGVPPYKETEHYVQVIPAKYNEYLGMVGGIDALGTIDPSLLAGSIMSMRSDAASVYAGHTNAMLTNAARRLRSIVSRIRETADPVEAVSLNTYARAEVARLTVMAVRLQAASTAPLSAEQLAVATVQAAEREFTVFTLEPVE